MTHNMEFGEFESAAQVFSIDELWSDSIQDVSAAVERGKLSGEIFTVRDDTVRLQIDRIEDMYLKTRNRPVPIPHIKPIIGEAVGAGRNLGKIIVANSEFYSQLVNVPDLDEITLDAEHLDDRLVIGWRHASPNTYGLCKELARETARRHRGGAAAFRYANYAASLMLIHSEEQARQILLG